MHSPISWLYIWTSKPSWWIISHKPASSSSSLSDTSRVSAIASSLSSSARPDISNKYLKKSKFEVPSSSVNPHIVWKIINLVVLYYSSLYSASLYASFWLWISLWIFDIVNSVHAILSNFLDFLYSEGVQRLELREIDQGAWHRQSERCCLLGLWQGVCQGAPSTPPYQALCTWDPWPCTFLVWRIIRLGACSIRGSSKISARPPRLCCTHKLAGWWGR